MPRQKTSALAPVPFIVFFVIAVFAVYAYVAGIGIDTGFPGQILPYNGQTVHPLKSLHVSSYYGERISPFTHQPENHSGIDLLEREGMAVMAVKDGNIVKKEYNPSYGNWIEIQHPDGTYTRYAHLSAFGNISIGQDVGAGSVIGAVGSTGKSTEPHLHFELRDRDGSPIDPSSLLGITNVGNRMY